MHQLVTFTLVGKTNAPVVVVIHLFGSTVKFFLLRYGDGLHYAALASVTSLLKTCLAQNVQF